MLLKIGRLDHSGAYQSEGVRMGNLGFPEMLVILVIVLVVFGPGKLPEIGKSLGKGIAEFRKASNEPARTQGESASDANHYQPSDPNNEE